MTTCGCDIMGTCEELVALPESRLTPELVTRYRQEGSWRDVTLDGYLAAAVAAEPDKLAAVLVLGAAPSQLVRIGA